MMTGTVGDYPMTRDASGTSWQPDSTPHEMAHVMRGDWMLAGHAVLNAVYDDQEGPRGDELGFVAGMVTGTARRTWPAGDTLTLRGMLSPDPFMGKRGYPLLLAAGESADGVTPLFDRQHPHELLMEVSATWSTPLGEKVSGFVYAGLPGEPEFGPPSFMHRVAAMASPEAPITHHWLDSTHITFGVVTAGWVRDAWKFEASHWQVFGRAERIETHDLTPFEETFDVSKLSLGALRDFRVGGRMTLGIGALHSFNSVPGALEASYGGDPEGTLLFIRLVAGT